MGSQILMPIEREMRASGKYMVGGVAFGGRYSISKVQVSLRWRQELVRCPDETPSVKMGLVPVGVRLNIATEGRLQDSGPGI